MGDRRLRLPCCSASSMSRSTRHRPANNACSLLQNCEARIAFVSSRKQYEKIAAVFVNRQASSMSSSWTTLPNSPKRSRCRAFCAPLPRKTTPNWKTSAVTIEPDDLATLIYTSGTTGTPKGVMLTHGNIASNLNVSLDMYEFDKDDLCVSFLPLSHVTARHLDYALINAGVPLAYCPVIDELPQAMQQVHPTLIVAVPARLREGIQHGAEQGSRTEAQTYRRGRFRLVPQIARRFCAAKRLRHFPGRLPTS